MGAALLGLPLGTWVQLQQAALWPLWSYAWAVAVGVLVVFTALRLLGRSPAVGSVRQLALLGAVVGGLALVGFAVTGGRAAYFDASRLPAHLQDRDIRVTGVVASLPRQRNGSTQFEFEVEQARGLSGAVALPGRVALTWGDGVFARPDATRAASITVTERPPDRVRPGERWEFTVRLRQPHGLANPHGFDQELRHWQLGVQATGQVRPTGPGGPPARLDEGRWAEPIDRARQAVRSAIHAQVPDTRSAGVVVALVVGD